MRSVKDTPRHKVGVVLGTGFFVILCAIIVFPVFAGLLASFRPGKELIRRGLSIDLDFSTMSLDNYTYLFSGNADSQKYFMWYKNSLIITIVSVVLTLLICYFVAYGLTMYNYRLKNFLFFLVIATMMVPFEILMLPLYKEIIAIGLIDSYVGVIITGLCSASTIFSSSSICQVCLRIFWMRQELTVLQSTVLQQNNTPTHKAGICFYGYIVSDGCMECNPLAIACA